MDSKELWTRYKKYLCEFPGLGLTLDVSRMHLDEHFLDRMEPEMQKAYGAMAALESGAVANPDEQRMVGHYWLRNPSLAPDGLAKDIQELLKSIHDFTFNIHAGKIFPRKRARFTNLLNIGIGGSALGPQFAADALGTVDDKMKPYFLDNTDPDGIARVLSAIGGNLGDTLTIVTSKSGSTIETRNGMLEVAAAYRKAGMSFERHAVAITGAGSKLDEQARKDSWLARFPMWDWVGGRTSLMSAVGLLPLSLQGVAIQELLAGAAQCDELTRTKNTRMNPAALLALSWFFATGGRGSKDMVILPYRDRLVLFPKYLQQLVMESLGKEKDMDGKTVNQGLTVYGNKGTTDQHAYVQQLRDGVDNFFATFIEVMNDSDAPALDVDAGLTSGDYLHAFLYGTRSALYEKGRQSITITLEKLDARSLGAVIALYERAVGFYASLVNINAYHQPGVEAGKKMAGAVITLQRAVMEYVKNNRGRSFTAEQIAEAVQAQDAEETVFKILEHASSNKQHGIIRKPSVHAYESRYEAAP